MINKTKTTPITCFGDRGVVDTARFHPSLSLFPFNYHRKVVPHGAASRPLSDPFGTAFSLETR